MIASVHGTVQAVRLDAAVVEVGGVGLLLHATPATLAGLRVGSTAQLATSLIVREDALTLFGFADAEGHTGDVRWNFEKWLVGADGSVMARFSPKTEPLDPSVVSAIDAAVA